MIDLNKLSIGEGNTPLIKLGKNLWAKCEFQNPTGSFKDRGSIAEVKVALKLKKKGVICASTGNMAASLAAYCARAKLNCLVVIPKITPESKLRQASICGAQLMKIDGNYDDCVAQAEFLASEKNYLLCGDYEIRRVASQSLGAELVKSKVKFSNFIVPFGNGNLGCAIAEGFVKEKQYPKFIAARAANPQTIASAIKVKNALDEQLSKKLNAQFIFVTDEEILKAQEVLAITYGLFVETSAATTFAAFLKLKPSGNTVLILTGSGLKEVSI